MFAAAGPPGLLSNDCIDSLRRSVDSYRGLRPDELETLHQSVHHLMTTKHWEGCGGLTLTQEIQLSIAGHAAIMTLGFPGYRFPNLRTVLVYPGGFLVPRLDGGRTHLDGPASQDGTVIVSWFGPEDMRRTAEVVVHEFAHLFDMLSGKADGLPPIADPDAKESWATAIEHEYETFAAEDAEGIESNLTPYAAISRSEFFAMGTERFFRDPIELRRERPRLYELLRDWYGQDPETRLDPAQPREGLSGTCLETDETLVGELESLLREAPDDTESWAELVALLDGREEWQPAEAALTALLELEPQNAQASYWRGVCRWRLDQLLEALADFNRTIALEPDFSAAYVARAELRLDLPDRDLDAALADIESALELDAKDPMAWAIRAWIDHAANEPIAAREACDRALSLAPHHPSATWCLGEILYDDAHYAAALTQAELAIERFEISGEDPPFACCLLRGFSFLRLGEYDSALAVANQVLAADPECSEALRLRAEASSELGSSA